MKRYFLLTLVLLSLPAFADSVSNIVPAGLPLLSVTHTPTGDQYSVKMQILLLMTALSFLPAALLLLTSFTRIVIVLGILRQALGLQQSPPNKVLIGIALSLTLVVMHPVLNKIIKNAYQPYQENKISLVQAAQNAELPLRHFMLAQTRKTDLALMLNLAKMNEHTPLAKIPFTLVIPAYVLSELKTAFEIGFYIYIPFMIIDLVVSSVLMSMGMMMLSPLVISLPFKLLLFVVVNGWDLTFSSLAHSFGH
ncbi:flagellar type III secretion system pore protein FliP [Vibrio marisflavi]|uniref:Flagellar biosynthetic protein FliP n=1 Tax=Vibrio marisflavi CECT 7928 TaxID=634439 RepID=A0ABM9A5I6_9VIBR|nr:flagellar type III secretion system pore protein FliP [Vibrio marisflavi]CAH0540099.1 Flagellar biosynthetic protein FliP [Vibrio marisflavi CECT 7928]